MFLGTYLCNAGIIDGSSWRVDCNTGCNELMVTGSGSGVFSSFSSLESNSSSVPTFNVSGKLLFTFLFSCINSPSFIKLFSSILFKSLFINLNSSIAFLTFLFNGLGRAK